MRWAPLPTPRLASCLIAACFCVRLSLQVRESGLGSDDEVKLVNLLFKHKGYNRLIRPVADLNQTVKVAFGLAMVQLINVEEKSQIMKSNVWLRMTWDDYQLRWDPTDFGGIKVIRVNPNKIWKPDIVLYNNADGKYEVSWQPNILIFNTGNILWIPPAIYKSSCTIHVRYFPFDQQECEMKFGSWTFDATQVGLDWYEGVKFMDLNDYWQSGSWDIIDCPGNITQIEKVGQAPQTMMIYTITIRRKTLFYTVNLIIPCVLISLLSVCVFYLPADAGEKMTLCISILLALVVFLLLVSKILPPTSISIPLISKYLLFTFIMNIITIVFTVIIINWNFRTPRTHKMPNWVRLVFLKYLPKLLWMKRPEHIKREENDNWRMDRMTDRCNGGETGGGVSRRRRRDLHSFEDVTGGGLDFGVNDVDDVEPSPELLELRDFRRSGRSSMPPEETAEAAEAAEPQRFAGVEVTPELRKAIAAINFISTHLRIEDEYKRVLQDWKYVASVIDRVQLLIFGVVTLVGTGAILLNAPFILDFEVRLAHLLFQHKGYNRLIRPVTSLNATVKVEFTLSIIQIINVEEKAQIMKSNVWLKLSWYDYQLRWDPKDFGGVSIIRVHPDRAWNPDIVLFNNADGKYETSWLPNILIYSSGYIMWMPPAIYQSTCTIHVRYFPFDQQECEMKFGSWTFDATQVMLDGPGVADMNSYWKSGSWDIIDCPGNVTKIEKVGQAPQTMMIYTITIRRKTLFYTVNLIIPCVLISLLSVCVFYLPADAGEKMTLCISILLALVVFLLLVSKILPPTSISIPLISKFLLFTFIMNTITIVFTVIIINWNFRTPRTHKMPNWVRLVFLKYLPQVLLMKRPEHIDQEEADKWRMDRMTDADKCNGGGGDTADLGADRQRQAQHIGAMPSSSFDAGFDSSGGLYDQQQPQQQPEQPPRGLRGLRVTPELQKSVAAINLIATHLRIEDEYMRVLQDWKYVASVIDRIQLVIFSTVTVIGTIAILMNAPFILDFVQQEAVVTELKNRFEKFGFLSPPFDSHLKVESVWSYTAASNDSLATSADAYIKKRALLLFPTKPLPKLSRHSTHIESGCWQGPQLKDEGQSAALRNSLHEDRVEKQKQCNH
uniref:Neur_chan_LBD domain-containing protein n=1 Tax=Macrostomum lignano TaxID=282301 RepID=A0A1I8IAX4_9PLAT